jgi:hypothetical protein
MRALIFPGQGSQKVGMARAMVEKFAWAAEMFIQADAIPGRHPGQNCFNGPGKSLAGLNNKISPSVSTFFAGDPQTLEQLLQSGEAS